MPSKDININTEITQTIRFLKGYMEIKEPLSPEAGDKIKALMRTIKTSGEASQKQLLFWILLFVCEKLTNMNEIELRTPLEHLTHFFTQQCPIEADTAKKAYVYVTPPPGQN